MLFPSLAKCANPRVALRSLGKHLCFLAKLLRFPPRKLCSQLTNLRSFIKVLLPLRNVAFFRKRYYCVPPRKHLRSLKKHCINSRNVAFSLKTFAFSCIRSIKFPLLVKKIAFSLIFAIPFAITLYINNTLANTLKGFLKLSFLGERNTCNEQTQMFCESNAKYLEQCNIF